VKIVLLGGGGHCKVAADAIQADGTHEIVGLLTKDGGPTDLELPIWGGDDLIGTLARRGVEGVFVAVGDSRVRRLLLDAVRGAGLDVVSVVHPSAVISPSARLGAGVAVFANAVINAGSVVGDGVIVNTGATVDHDARIGRDVHIAPGCHLAGSVTIGDRTMLGTSCVVIPGITIGRDAVVGAGTVVYRDVPDEAKVVGGGMRFLTVRPKA
jgi:UDP-perosamine 4-acetyltransferase